MTAKFKKGEIVQLKSGGPTMTVKGVIKPVLGDEDEEYVCQWFGGKKLEQGFFPPESLKTVAADDK